MNYKIYIKKDRKTNKIVADFIRNSLSEYKKRLSRFCKIETIYYTGLIKAEGYKILVSNAGNSVTSEKLALNINKLGVSGVSNVCFFFDDNSGDFDSNICISKMDMSPDLLGLILYEQIYRGYKILGGETYHH